ncbi:MAG TPA: hypothetical protein VK184_18225 [Nostocaceae cyanobacterium]|nr:hypothetical protein [Nostocaceae cyanobacterium]
MERLYIQKSSRNYATPILVYLLCKYRELSLIYDNWRLKIYD